MNLKEILSYAKGISSNSKEVREGYVFVAIKGTQVDGHDFVEEALQRGALYALVEREVGIKDPRIIKVEDTRRALGELASLFYGEVSKRLKIVGITGTNGKTTTTHIIESILNKAGIKTGLMGTIYYRLGENIYEYEGRTTPDPIKWHSTLKAMWEEGASAVVCEVSSHALDQKRIWGTDFYMVGFTNLSQDHLDYHGTMEDYFLAKARLFEEYAYTYAVINEDDPYGKRLKAIAKNPRTYGREGDLKILDFQTDFEGSRLRVAYEGKVYDFFSNLRGNFQAYNLSLGILVGFLWGLESQAIQEGIRQVQVPGRFETYKGKGFVVIIDYAHTPDALEKVLRTARALCKNRLIVVFGAGGNRDRTKRPLMGKTAEAIADLIVLTSDNPRFEEPMAIIEDILSGIENRGAVLVEQDRRKAIELAISMAQEGDVILIAGKGHEDYQEIKGVKYPFKDSEVVKEVLGV
ncbi:UDP-N-acetylmuramoyl-L-alanyl-D-glutamate--2,6-diaminopimelate ligase [Pampinifervens florentissimum]|uniref:UDP-N-acetylmuramoyl-L-alanyl-D-glutamate--2, 6-diaminopimelate ligase n=1 Tax=Pampinifervens florentissimum TaxID=1632019 RepID=UPI0013B490F0|nr:UDP-N-acetylmuramoyl-L-alanyl-D-glutamate--2,6-diaminopimelate ligase [Hydrogenobacter sp. T-8]QID33506.1 UDP-N-acetylmuramoyl-L-alanyl-D-glutamate--2,6-diaminopimelate ligase [Hydrogenobacter sp. T-8]